MHVRCYSCCIYTNWCPTHW